MYLYEARPLIVDRKLFQRIHRALLDQSGICRKKHCRRARTNPFLRVSSLDLYGRVVTHNARLVKGARTKVDERICRLFNA